MHRACDKANDAVMIPNPDEQDRDSSSVGSHDFDDLLKFLAMSRQFRRNRRVEVKSDLFGEVLKVVLGESKRSSKPCRLGSADGVAGNK